MKRIFGISEQLSTWQPKLAVGVFVFGASIAIGASATAEPVVLANPLAMRGAIGLEAAVQPVVDMREQRVSATKRSLAAKLKQRERLSDTSQIARPVLANASGDLLSGSESLTGDEVPSGSNERALMGKVNIPYGLGSVTMVSQQLDENGNVEGMNFFSVDRPESAWDIDVDVKDGAKFEFTRKWGAKSNKKPFKSDDKARVALPSNPQQ